MPSAASGCAMFLEVDIDNGTDDTLWNRTKHRYEYLSLDEQMGNNVPCMETQDGGTTTWAIHHYSDITPECKPKTYVHTTYMVAIAILHIAQLEMIDRASSPFSLVSKCVTTRVTGSI